MGLNGCTVLGPPPALKLLSAPLMPAACLRHPQTPPDARPSTVPSLLRSASRPDRGTLPGIPSRVFLGPPRVPPGLRPRARLTAALASRQGSTGGTTGHRRRSNSRLMRCREPLTSRIMNATTSLAASPWRRGEAVPAPLPSGGTALVGGCLCPRLPLALPGERPRPPGSMDGGRQRYVQPGSVQI